MYLQPLTPSSFHTSHKQPRSQEQKRGLRFLIFTFLDRTLGFKNLQFLVSPEGYTSHLTNTATTDRLISREMCIRSPGSGFLFTVSISCSGVDVRKRQMGRGGGGWEWQQGVPPGTCFNPDFLPRDPVLCPWQYTRSQNKNCVTTLRNTDSYDFTALQLFQVPFAQGISTAS
jgi:hypothetical protein